VSRRRSLPSAFIVWIPELLPTGLAKTILPFARPLEANWSGSFKTAAVLAAIALPLRGWKEILSQFAKPTIVTVSVNEFQAIFILFI